MVDVSGWNESSSSDDDFFVNPGFDSFEEVRDVEPEDFVEETGEWDVVKTDFRRSSVDEVRIDSDKGLIQVDDGSNESVYFLAAVNDSGMSVVDSNGRVSTSEQVLMDQHHHTAITESVLDGFTGNDAEVRSLARSPGDVYDELMETGVYTALDGDVEFYGFDDTKGVDKYESDMAVTEKFLDQLDDIAEFYRDFEEDYNTTTSGDKLVDIPIRPERKSEGNTYKFRCRGTDKNDNIVVSNDYEVEDGVLRLKVEAFGNHNSDANRY